MASLEALEKAKADSEAAAQYAAKYNKDVRIYYDAAKMLKDAAQAASSAYMSANSICKDLEAFKVLKSFNTIDENIDALLAAAKTVEVAASNTVKASVTAVNAVAKAAEIPVAMGRANVTAAKAAHARTLAIRLPEGLDN